MSPPTMLRIKLLKFPAVPASFLRTPPPCFSQEPLRSLCARHSNGRLTLIDCFKLGGDIVMDRTSGWSVLLAIVTLLNASYAIDAPAQQQGAPAMQTKLP